MCCWLHPWRGLRGIGLLGSICGEVVLQLFIVGTCCLTLCERMTSVLAGPMKSVQQLIGWWKTSPASFTASFMFSDGTCCRTCRRIDGLTGRARCCVGA